MLIIGHRGAAGLAPENTMAAFRAGYEADADMLECDIRLTKDRRLVIVHDARLTRTHHRRDAIAALTYDQIEEYTKDKPVPLIDDLLKKYFGKVLLNIELKSRGTGEMLIEILRKNYIKKATDWDNIIISSFKGSELVRIHHIEPRANLALLQDQNPFLFIAYTRLAGLRAVGFHRLYLNKFALEVAKRSNLFIYAYTVNRPAAMRYLEDQGIHGVVTNYPDKFSAALSDEAAHAS